MSTVYLFPELETRRAQNDHAIRLSSLRFVQRALHRMWEDSGYWHGDGYVDKITGENVFSRLTWHIIAASDNTITVMPTDDSDCRNRAILSYSYPGEEGNSLIHGVRYGCVAPGDRLQVSFPSVWAIGHNAVIRKVEYVGSNHLKLTLDRAVTGLKNSTHPRYKIGTYYEVYKATINDVSYTDGAGAPRWTTETTWAIDGAIVVTTTRRCIPPPWLQISPRTKRHGCQFCMCDHSNSVANLAASGTAIDEDGRHWYCARRKFFEETFVPYPEGESQGGGQYTYTWKSPSGLPKFEPDAFSCGGDCDQYFDSYDDGSGEVRPWAYFDESIHMCRVLDDWWQSIPLMLETYLPTEGEAVFRSQAVGVPSILAQARIPGELNKRLDVYTTQLAPMGAWMRAYLTEDGDLTISEGEAFTPADGWQNPKWGFGPRVKCFQMSGRGACDFVKPLPVMLHPRKLRKILAERVVDEVKFDLHDGTGRIFLKQRRLQVTVGGNRYTFDAAGGAGFFLPNGTQPNNGDDQSYGSTWGGVRKYDNVIITSPTNKHGKIRMQIEVSAYAGDGADTPQHWHLLHEYWQSSEDPEGIWTIDDSQDDVDVAPPVSLFSGATEEEIALRMRYRDSLTIPVEAERGDVPYDKIEVGDVITFERPGM